MTRPEARPARPVARPFLPEDGDAASLAAAFAVPDAAGFGPVPIWWWSGGTVRPERLTWQMRQLRSQGVAQAVVMNLAPTGPLFGSLADDPAYLTEEWWQLFEGACEVAEDLDFRLWPYDQVGFSGANFQGRLVTQRPEWAGQALGRVEVHLDHPGGASLSTPHGAVALLAYVTDGGSRTTPVEVVDGTARWEGPGDRLVLVFAQENGFDYYSPAACAALIDTVHGEFARRVGRWFGTVIPGFFQDELPTTPTWGPRFAASFAADHAYDLTSVLPALWGEPIEGVDGRGGELTGERVRLDYHRHRAASARRSFFDPLERWFAEHGLVCGFDQQSPAREGHPTGAVGLYGDYLGTHRGYAVPGSDHWGDTKLHSSLAHAHGHRRTWIEAFHSSGWGGTLEETYDWLAPFLRRGATLFDPHAVYYSTAGGWWEWAPPSTCFRQPYWPEYHVLSGAVARLCRLFSTGRHVSDTVLLHPSTTAQGGTALDGPLPAAARSAEVYQQLNGEPAWYHERRGVLESAGWDYSVLDDAALARGAVDAGVLRLGDLAFRNAVLPAATALDAAAAGRLADLADSGGTVVVVGAAPSWFPGGEGDDGGDRFAAALARGRVRRVDTAAEVPAALHHGPVHVEADAPALLRRVGTTTVVGVFAHDDRTGTRQPIMPGVVGFEDFVTGGWDTYWRTARDEGYGFVPVTGRSWRVVLHGLDPGSQVQQWDPRDGTRRAVAALADAGGSLTVDGSFCDGSVTVLVAGTDLPPADGVPDVAGEVVAELSDFSLLARSRLDNTWGDVGPRDQLELLPPQVWSLESAEGDQPSGWYPVTATYGPFAVVTGPVPAAVAEPWRTGAAWAPASWSLSRGIQDDPTHGETLGPKGYVPEEFLAWAHLAPGEQVGLRTTLDVPDDGRPATLVVGAGAPRTVLLDGVEAPVGGEGHWTLTPLAPGARAVELWFRAVDAGELRASFAVVTDTTAYRRPEWVVAEGESTPASTVEVETVFTAPAGLRDARVQIGSEQPCTVVVNGVEVGRQSAFDPYEGRRFARYHHYDLRALLREGDNVLSLRSTSTARGAAVLVDSAPVALGGLGVVTGAGRWTARRDGVQVGAHLRHLPWQDPRAACIVARPHPLPGAGWLEEVRGGAGAVVPVVPDLDPSQHEVRWLRLGAPLGARTLTVPTELAFTAWCEGGELAVEGPVVRLPAAAEGRHQVLLRFDRPGGRRGGALLEGPVSAEVGPAAAPLVDWGELGLGALAGEVAYRTTLPAVPLADGERLVLDLGAVRGSVQVLLAGAPVASLAWSPYRADLTSALRAALAGRRTAELELEVVVRGTLAGYLQVASPTPAVFRGQERAGLRGPVRLEKVAAPADRDAPGPDTVRPWATGQGGPFPPGAG